MPTTIAELVGTHPLFAGMPQEVVAQAAGCARNVSFHAGDLLLVEGTPADTFYLLRRGSVSLAVHAPGTGDLVVETLRAGQVVGWSWLFPPYVWHFDARALEPVGAIALDGACLRAKSDADPAVGFELMKRFSAVMLDRLQSTRMRLLDLYGRGDAR